MKIYVTADMEGVTGLVDAQDVQPGGVDYERGRAMMTADVNAAVRGALAAGATEILVNDAHGPMRNILLDELHPAARLVRGRPKPMGMAEGLDGTATAALCVGYHARAGALGVMSHSFMGHEIEDMWLDDRPVGEIGLLHATAAALGVPVVMLSGDDTACAEAAAWDPRVTTVPVKYAHDRFAAELRPADEARAAIEAAARDAVARAHDLTDPTTGQRPDPRLLAVRWQSASVASCLLAVPGVTTRDDRTIQVSAPMPALYRLLGVFLRVAASLTNQPPYC
jgi:D-amino peptidase